MSRNSKNATRYEQAKVITMMHQKGEKGPSRTATKHEKRWGYRSNPEVLKRQQEAHKAAAAEHQKKTSGAKILKDAGKASKDA
jgi:hypothetical protein